jgi:ribosomal protein S18 acetylase RimI-like enzyme
MSFWAESPGPHWSDCFWSTFSCQGVPHAYPIRKLHLPKPKLQFGEIFVASEDDAIEICIFLQNHFKITKKSQCILSPEKLSQGLQQGWIFLILRNQDGLICGTIASRPLGTCHFQSRQKGEFLRSKCPNVGYIDFFCVHPDFQKSGVGSDLLRWIDYSTSNRNRFIHLFQKELSPLYALPPLWKGMYIVREIAVHGSNPKITPVSVRTLPAQLQSSFSMTFLPDHKAFLPDTQILRYNCKSFIIYVAITDTFHKADTGGTIGEVLFYRIEGEELPRKTSIAAAIEEILESSGYNFILMDESIPHQSIRGWRQDSPYYMYCYNVNPRTFFSCRPELLL